MDATVKRKLNRKQQWKNISEVNHMFYKNVTALSI